MKYLKKDLGAYRLHMIQTEKFKTITVRVAFRSPVVKDEITIRNVLCDMFLQSSKNYPNKRALTIKAQDLYAADIQTYNLRLGNYNNLDFYLSVLNDKYTEPGNFEATLKFFSEIIFQPDVHGQKFNKEKLDIVKATCKSALSSLKEDAASYSLMRLFEAMDKERVSSYRMVGYLEDLEKIDEKKLYQYYTNLIRSDLVDVFVLGNIDFKETMELIRKYIPLKTVKRQRVPYMLEEIKAKPRRLIARETIDTTQSKLSIGLRVYGLSTYERNYVLTLFNIILGGSGDSKLFKEVREENSLCYVINSVPNKLDHLILIRAGIDRENYTKTIEVIDSVIADMRKGKISEDELMVAKEYFCTALDELEESPSRVIDNYYMMEIMGTDTIEEKRKRIQEVTKEEIVKVAKKVKMDTIFLLEGETNGES